MSIAHDKLLHIVAGALIACTVAVIVMFAGHVEAAGLAAFFAAGVAGVAKEAADFFLNERAVLRGEAPVHGVETSDALHTLLGGMLVALPVGILPLLIA